jgi:hypothetical protein
MTRWAVLSMPCAIAVALGPVPAMAEPQPVDSWGRANVDYETYRKDSLECGLQGYTADVSETAQAKAFVGATRQLESVDNSNFVAPNASPQEAASAWAGQAQRYEQIRRGIRPERQMLELKQGMTAVVGECLRRRGYVQFRLTDEQSAALAKLDKGSDARREYLHGLASNAELLNAQALPPPKSSPEHR